MDRREALKMSVLASIGLAAAGKALEILLKRP